MRTETMTVSTFRWIVGIIIVAAVAFGVGWRLSDDRPDEAATPSPTVASVPTAADTGIRASDSVTFVNATDGAFWPASDPHPSHDQCPGFDARRVLRRGESYTVPFSVPQVCGFHDHTAPSASDRLGTITVR